MNPIKKLAGQTAIYGLSSIVGRLLNYLLVPLYTRVFLPAEYGVVTEIYAYVSFLNVVLTYGMETGFFRFFQTESNKKSVYSTILVSLLISSSVFTLICILFSQSIANVMGYANHSEYITWFAIIISIDAVTSIPFALLRVQNKALKFVFIRLINIGVNIGLNVFFIIICPHLIKSSNPLIHNAISSVYNPEIGVGYVFISNLFASVITLILLLPYLTGFKFDYSLWKKIIKYSLPLLIVGLAGIINETFDRILLKHLLPDKSTAMAQLGIYGACYKISILMTIFIQTFRFAAEPFFFAEAKKSESRDIYAEVLKYFVITCSIIFLGIMMYFDFVKLFVGKEFYSGLHIVPILLLANMCLGVYYNLSIWYKLTGKTVFGAYLSVFGAVVTLILNFWWIPIYGYTGSAWATFFCYFLIMVASYFIGQKYYPVNYNLLRILSYILISVFLYFLSIIINIQTLVYRIFINSILFFSFLVLIYLLERKKIIKAVN
ncbi:MAG: oligosaccharide flippase family protein [Bacteroidota bacterium]|nr:oligosaccharide flippase family protein [Bacteroidota bacterium]